MRRSGGGLRLQTVLAVMATMLTCAVCRSPVRHLVGGNDDRWKPNVNYTVWSLQQVFYVGDWLYFVYDKNLYNVLEVNETSYGNCSDQGFILDITRGAGHDVFELTQPKRYYFLSSGGYCYNGMQVSINVVEFVPALQGSQSNSGSRMIRCINLFVLSIVIVVWAVLVCNQGFTNSRLM